MKGDLNTDHQGPGSTHVKCLRKDAARYNYTRGAMTEFLLDISKLNCTDVLLTISTKVDRYFHSEK